MDGLQQAPPQGGCPSQLGQKFHQLGAFIFFLLGHRLGDGWYLVDWNSGVSVRPYVRTSTKRFSDFHLIWCVGSPRPDVRISVTST